MEPDDATELVDGCDADMTVDPLPDDESELFALFAEALDPTNGNTVEGARADWEKLFDAAP
jgi:hypothetical protein